MTESTPEQEARDMLEMMGMPDAQSMTAGDVVLLANLIAEVRRLREELDDWECSEDRNNGHLNSAQPFWSPPT
jgi:hypothetical protein